MTDPPPTPIAPSNAPHVSASGARGAGGALSGTVLVAEDTPELMAVVQLYLRRLGLTAVCVSDGAQAVDAALREEPRAILMDLEMPVMHGLDAVRRLREAGFRAPILAMTAHTGERERAAALAAGFSGVMGKPISQAQLQGVLEAALGTSANTPARAKEEAMADNPDWQVDVDRDLEDLVPVYLDARKADVDKLAAGLAAGDFDLLRLVGHSMKGASHAYGFHAVARMGELIEKAALAREAETIRAQADLLRDYLGRVQVRLT